MAGYICHTAFKKWKNLRSTGFREQGKTISNMKLKVKYINVFIF
jgi:hypothetical protein